MYQPGQTQGKTEGLSSTNLTDAPIGGTAVTKLMSRPSFPDLSLLATASIRRLSDLVDMIYYEDIGGNVTHRKISTNTLPTKGGIGDTAMG